MHAIVLGQLCTGDHFDKKYWYVVLSSVSAGKRMVQEPSSCRWMATSVDRLTIDSDDTHVVVVVVVVLTMLSARQTKIAMTTLTAAHFKPE
jgi:hypothetical protein